MIILYDPIRQNMCGIYGAISDKKVEELKKDFDKIKHRGPCGSRLVSLNQNQRVTFGFHRLAINNLSDNGMQPFCYKSAFVVCNGEIYNYKQLALKYNFDLKNKSDCEVILFMYNEFGRNMNAVIRISKELDAEFAFIIYDIELEKIFASRDPFGVRPLFYSIENDVECYFSSEAKCLKFPEPLLPGNIMYMNLNNFSIGFHKYFYLDTSINSNENLNTIHSKIRILLEEAVKKRLMSDRPIGCFLSGGLDSSLICSILSKKVKNLHCFSIGMSENSYDIIAAKKVVKFLGIPEENHHCVYFTVKEGFDAIRKTIYHNESWDITTTRASIPQFLLSKYISENTNIKVLFSGEGADESQNGYQYGKMINDAGILIKDTSRLLSNLYRYDNLRVDRTTSAFGLEVRIPFLDPKLIQYLFNIQPELRLSNTSIEKKLFRDAFEGYLPEDILRRSKEAFSDAVSTIGVSWYKLLQDMIIENDIISYDKSPIISEGDYYKKIYDEFFSNDLIKDSWLPPKEIVGSDILDPSATVLECYL